MSQRLVSNRRTSLEFLERGRESGAWQLRPRLKPHIVVGSKCDQAFCVCFQREARFERLRIDMATVLRPQGEKGAAREDE